MPTLDDPAEKIDRADRAESDRNLDPGPGQRWPDLYRRVDHAWAGRRHATGPFALILSCSPSAHNFCHASCPYAAWVGRQHGVTRQRASELWREFAEYIAPYVQFKGQRFLNQRNGSQKRRGRVRQGTEGPQPGPVAGA